VSTLIAALAVAAWGALAISSPGEAQQARPIVIGASVSLTGDFSEDGKAIQQGYMFWADEVNKHGGVLGRQVTMKFADDASSTQQVVTNYQNLIARDKVDLVVGPFSSLLTIPASVVAHRYGYAFLAPAGGGPKVFQQGFNNFFFVQPAPVADQLNSFARWVLTRTPRPRTAAYATEDDPFAKPQVDNARKILEAGGVRTLSNKIWRAETTDYTPIALAIAQTKADIVVLGTTGLPEAVAFVKSFIQQHYNPKALIEASGPDEGAQFSKAVGEKATEGIMVSAGWWAGAKTYHNQEFVAGFIAQHGGKPEDISQDTAEAYATGQVLQQAVERIHNIDNTKLIAELHRSTFQTVLGPLKWDSAGRPQGEFFLVQWQGGKPVPVYPPSMAVGKPEYPKSPWQ
jgi:branched-chain amino acid transport system substrate-binding protein